MSDSKVTIVGAGLAGSLLGLYLAKRGLEVEVFEKRSDVRTEGAVGTSGGEGRSINLALSTRGLHALEEVGLAEKVRATMIAMKGRMVHPIKGALSLAPYGRNDSEVINSVSRNALNALLLTELGKLPGVSLHFRTRCTGYDFAKSELVLHDEVSGETRRLPRKQVIGTDGSASALRVSMLGQGHFDFSQSYLDHSYKELTIPPGKNGEFQLEQNALHLWPRGGYMMIALPNIDKSFTCTLFFPHTGPVSFAALDTKEKVRSFFSEQFPDAVPLISNLENDFFKNPTGNLITVKCSPWFVQDQVLLLGDAAHAIVPFYGQGMNCSFEDCSLFNKVLDRQGTNWAAAFEEFAISRKRDADAIADLAVDNFIEMRDTSANPKFVMKKHLEHHLEDKYPGEFISKYSMVTFHRVPYSVAMKKGRIQDKVLMAACERVEKLEEINLEATYQAIKQELRAVS